MVALPPLLFLINTFAVAMVASLLSTIQDLSASTFRSHCAVIRGQRFLVGCDAARRRIEVLATFCGNLCRGAGTIATGPAVTRDRAPHAPALEEQVLRYV